MEKEPEHGIVDIPCDKLNEFSCRGCLWLTLLLSTVTDISSMCSVISRRQINSGTRSLLRESEQVYE